MITYFIQSGEFVKIGKTESIASRMNQLATGSPFPLMVLKTATMPESVAHSIADTLTERGQGEWFKVNQDLLDWISAIESVTPESVATNGWITYSIRIPADLRKQVGELAKGLQTSKADAYRRAIKAGLKILVDQLASKTTNTSEETA